MKVINLFGGPGCGKSTAAAGLFHLMKSNHMSVELVNEFAKEIVWENNLVTLCSSCHSKTNYSREKWIIVFNKMITLEMRVIK